MKLFLASEAKNSATIKELEKFIGGFEEKQIAYIPTASNGEGWESWKNSDTLQLLRTYHADIQIVLLENYLYDSVLRDLEGKDILWFAGGQCGYLMYWVRRTQLDKHIKDLLGKGSIYVGSSAGSMITGKSLDVVEWYIGETEHGAGVIPGMGLVDFDIYPHYKDENYEQIKKMYKGNRLYLLKDGEEIIVEDGNVKVIGEERIIKNSSSSRKLYS